MLSEQLVNRQIEMKRNRFKLIFFINLKKNVKKSISTDD